MVSKLVVEWYDQYLEEVQETHHLNTDLPENSKVVKEFEDRSNPNLTRKDYVKSADYATVYGLNDGYFEHAIIKERARQLRFNKAVIYDRVTPQIRYGLPSQACKYCPTLTSCDACKELYLKSANPNIELITKRNLRKVVYQADPCHNCSLAQRER